MLAHAPVVSSRAQYSDGPNLRRRNIPHHARARAHAAPGDTLAGLETQRLD